MDYAQIINSLVTRYNEGSPEVPSGDEIDAADHNYQNEAIRAIVDELGPDGVSGAAATLVERLTLIEGRLDALEEPAASTRGQMLGYVPPSDAIVVSPGLLSASFIGSYPAGTKFALEPGTHRITEELSSGLKAGMEFHGRGGAVVSGAQILSGWTDDGGSWSITGQTQEFTAFGASGICQVGFPRCGRSEAVFFDDEPLIPVDDILDLVTGTFFFDYAADTIHIADDPTGHKVEASKAAWALRGSQTRTSLTGVTVKNLIFEKFGSPLQEAPIDTEFSEDWTVENCVLRLNHGTGLRLSGNRARAHLCIVTKNGQLGIGGSGFDTGFLDGNDITVDDCEVTENNWAGVLPGWEGGGTKFVSTTRLTVRDSTISNNAGAGLWTDHDNLDTVFSGNHVEANTEFGIFHEISYDATISNNTVVGNGHGSAAATWAFGAGIQVANGQNVQVTGNVLSGNRNSITLIQQERADFMDGRGGAGFTPTENVLVHDNTVATSDADGKGGALQDFDNSGANSIHDAAANIRFRANDWTTPAGQSHWAWDGAMQSWANWQAAGQDVAVTEVDSFSGESVDYEAGSQTDA